MNDRPDLLALRQAEQARLASLGGAASYLWSHAPRWRGLALASTALIALTAGAAEFLPTLSPMQNAQVSIEPAASKLAPATSSDGCKLDVPDAPDIVLGKIKGFASDAEVTATTQRVELQVGGKMSSRFLTGRRVQVEAYPAGSGWTSLAVAPSNGAVQIGDVVKLSSRYKDPQSPCAFIPWQVVQDLGPSSASQ